MFSALDGDRKGVWPQTFCTNSPSWNVLSVCSSSFTAIPSFHHFFFFITFNALTTQQPSYLAELLSVHVPRRDLRSGNYKRLHIPRNKLKFTDRAFSHAALLEHLEWTSYFSYFLQYTGTFQTVTQN